jgi:hypothetical protein
MVNELRNANNYPRLFKERKIRMSSASVGLQLLTFALLLSRASSRFPSEPSRRSLTDRTSAFDTSDLNCQIGSTHGPGAKVKSFSIPYYYALGTTGTMDFMETFDLQQKIFRAITNDIAWCYTEESNPVVASGASNSSTNSSRRLFAEDKGAKLYDMARQLSILSVAAGPTQENIGKYSKCHVF